MTPLASRPNYSNCNRHAKKKPLLPNMTSNPLVTTCKTC